MPVKCNILKDDRSVMERKTHTAGVAGVDTVLSGLGPAAGGHSVACWACRPEMLDRVKAWVEQRSDMKRIQTIGDLAKWQRRAAHIHIYVVNDGHPAIA